MNAEARVAITIMGGALMILLAGCSEYTERRDGIFPVAGDAVRANVATHVIDPWPRASQDRHITHSAPRLVGVIGRHNTAPAGQTPATGSNMQTGAQSGSSPAPQSGGR